MNPLTDNAINEMFMIVKGRQSFVVEASRMRIIDDCMRLEISDGLNTSKALILMTKPHLDLRKVGKPYGTEAKYLIQIKEFTSFEQNGKTFIEILDFTPLERPGTSSGASLSATKSVKFQNQQRQTSKKVPEHYRPIQPIKFEGTTQKPSVNDSQMDVEDEQIDADQLRRFDKITDLFVDISSWEIVVRILEKSYREFNNKSGKLTKLLSLMLVDRTGTKIEGVMFGQSAKDYDAMLKKNYVYKMSRGQIREESYKKDRGDKFSRFNIIFTRNSIFVPLKDIPLIPYAVDANVGFKEFLKETNYQKQFDTVAILLDVGEERTFQKDGRSIYKRSLIIGDPQLLKSIEVVVWNKDMIFQNEWLNRTIQLRNFRLNTYRETVSLNSVFKSDIKLLTNHRFAAYEGKYSLSNYVLIYESDNGNQPVKERPTKTIRELDNEIQFMSSSEPIYSDIDIWLTHASFKTKWFYEACNNPKCKKGTESLSICIHCQHYNDSTQRKFIIPIEISDITGSLWTTAFDEFVQQIFKGIPIENLNRLEENEMREEAEKRLYQQFRVRLSTKKEYEGSIKHSIVGRVMELSIDKAAISNVEKIKKIMY